MMKEGDAQKWGQLASVVHTTASCATVPALPSLTISGRSPVCYHDVAPKLVKSVRRNLYRDAVAGVHVVSKVVSHNV